MDRKRSSDEVIEDLGTDPEYWIDLAGVRIQDIEDKAFCDLVRAWSAAKQDLRRAR